MMEQEDTHCIQEPEKAYAEVTEFPVPPGRLVGVEVPVKIDGAGAPQPGEQFVIPPRGKRLVVAADPVEHLAGNDVAFPPPHPHTELVEQVEIPVEEPV